MHDDARIELFLSHGPEDQEYVEEFTLLVAGSIKVGREQVASTAVPDYADRDRDQLPRVWVSFVSPGSVESGCLRAELASRWGGAFAPGGAASGQTILVVLHGLEPNTLPEGLSGLVTFRADDGSELDALLVQLGRTYGEKAPESRLLPSERERRLARLVELGGTRAPPPSIRRRRRPVLWLTAMAALGGAAGWAAHRAASSPGVYGFEQGAEGWTTTGGCIAARQSKERTKSGQFALELAMQLGSAERQGEAWVDMRKSRPPGVGDVPLNLDGHTVRAYVYAPRGAKGDSRRPNGFQLFVKDDEWRAAYGPWQNVIEEEWVRIELEVGAPAAPGGFVAAGFDPGKIIAVGVKLGLPPDAPAAFSGSVYLDAVDW
jgi:hypothetical protein